jgi:hypothetical protein
MQSRSKLSPEQWAEARRLRSEGKPYAVIAGHFGVGETTICSHARKEGWSAPAGGEPTPGRARAPRASPATAGIRGRLAQRLYKVIECKIKIMELRMTRQLQAHEAAPGDAVLPAPTKDERDSFAALIESINKVTEMASEPAPAADGRRRAATGAINTELTALSSDIEPDGLAAASEKDALRRDIAERLAKIFPPS